MPVEIKELTIKVNINQPQQANATPAVTAGNSSDDKEALLKDAVEQVLQIIENKKER